MNKKELFNVIALGFSLYILSLVLKNGFRFSLPQGDPFKPADALVEGMWLKMKFYWSYSLLGFFGLIGMVIGIQKSIDVNGFHVSKWFGVTALSFIVFMLSYFKIFG